VAAVTTGILKRVQKPQSDHYCQQANAKVFYWLPATRSTVIKHWRHNIYTGVTICVTAKSVKKVISSEVLNESGW